MTILLDNSLQEALRDSALEAGETEEEFIRVAVVDRIAQTRRMQGASLLARVREITAPVAATARRIERLPNDEAIGYNENGLFD